MKTGIVVATILLVLPTLAVAGDFRDATWGMSVEQVLSTESSKPVEQQSNTVTYKDRVADLDCNVIFYFFEDQLFRGVYLFQEKHVSPERHAEDFESINKNLITKYGAATRSEKQWTDDTLKEHMLTGAAVAAGMLTLLAYWETGKTTIVHVMEGDNFEIQHVLAYDNPELSEKIFSEEFEKDQSKF